MKKLITYSLSLLSCVTLAQEKTEVKKDKDMPRGNVKYADKKYAEAEADYRISASKNPEKMASLFNLGNSIYKQKQIAESKIQYEKVIELGQSHFEKHRAYHNLGNIYMAEKKYPEAVEAYKNALKNDPTDEETRYNYALAKKFIKKPPPPKDNKNQKKQPQPKPQPQPQPQPKPDPKKDDDKNQGQDKPQPKDGEGQQNPKPQPKPGGISKQRLEGLLKAVDNEERKVQDKVSKKREKAPPVPTEKDW
jgi:tetratricopeptide (TPR) repeat protein